jgi:hypothetical protein
MIFTFKKRAYQLGSKIIIMSIWTTKKNGNAAYACTRNMCCGCPDIHACDRFGQQQNEGNVGRV